MTCQYATPLSPQVNSCGLGLHGGSPSSGVCAGCMARGENNAEFSAAQKAKLSSPSPQAGPGTELKKLLKRVGITATPTCSCNARARTMDEEEAKEPGWCEAHLDEIVGWLREEANKRGLPFFDSAGKLLVKKAIQNHKKQQRMINNE